MHPGCSTSVMFRESVEQNRGLGLNLKDLEALKKLVCSNFKLFILLLLAADHFDVQHEPVSDAAAAVESDRSRI